MPRLPRHRGWSIPRVVPLLAGFVVLVGTILAAAVSPWWLLLTGFAGANLLLYGTVGWCPASLLMAQLGIPAGDGALYDAPDVVRLPDRTKAHHTTTESRTS